MNNQEKKNYEAPQLTVVSFKVEQGFNASDTKVFTLGMLPEDEPYDYGMQDYEVQGNQSWF